MLHPEASDALSHTNWLRSNPTDLDPLIPEKRGQTRPYQANDYRDAYRQNEKVVGCILYLLALEPTGNG